MKEDTKKGLAVLGGVLALAGAVALAKKAEGEEPPIPPEPPPEGTGRVQGYVVDAGTSIAIPLAKIHVDGKPSATADMTGGFRTSYMDYGSHTLTIYADGYQSTDFEVLLEESLLQLNFPVEPTEEMPGFPNDIAVTGIVVQPESARLGETVAILVHLLGPYPDTYPRTVTGTIYVNGGQLTQTIEMRFRNPAMSFLYTPTAAGTYTARAKDRSATFEVLADIIGTFYDPFGCVAPTENGAWESKWGLLDYWPQIRHAMTTNEHCHCMVEPEFYGGGTGASGYIGTVYCGLCNEAMNTRRIPGDFSYVRLLAEMLFGHIESAHPEVQWDRPSAWLGWVEAAFDIFCVHGHCNYEILIDGSKAWRYPSVSRRIAAPNLVLAPGEHVVRVEGLALGEGYPYRYVTFERTIAIDNYGDRLTLNVETGSISVVRWATLVGG